MLYTAMLPGRRFSSLRATSLLFVILFSVCGCQSSNALRESGSKTAIAGQKLCDKAIAVYSSLLDFQEIVRRQNATADLIATGVIPPSTTQPTASGANLIRKNLATRIDAYRALRKLYQGAQQLSDAAFADQSQNAASNLTAAYNGLKNVPDLPPTAAALLPDITKVLIGRLQAGVIKDHNRRILVIAQAYSEAWEQDAEVLRDYVRQKNADYWLTLSGAPDNKFDEKRLGDELKTPFDKGTNVGIWKLRAWENSDERTATFVANLDAVRDAWKDLISAHAELSLDQPSISNAQYLLDAIMELLEDIKPTRK